MAIIVENGSGVAGANSYVTASYVAAYLAERGRAGENGWTSPGGADEDAACIEASQYTEDRFRSRFAGRKLWTDTSLARALLTFTGQPANLETVTLGVKVYRFVNALAQANDVLIGASTSESVSNLVAAIMLGEGSGETYDAATAENDDAQAGLFLDDSLLAFALATGTAGNAVSCTDTVAAASWNFATLHGGSSVVRPQPLSFPRCDIYDRDGVLVVGMPDDFLHGVAEYAVRARSAVLAPDPTFDSSGGIVASISKSLGSLSKSVSYVNGTTTGMRARAYPAADRLFEQYLGPTGGVFR